MLTFPTEYFQPETRDGFYIDSKMKRAWAAQLEVLEEIRRICILHDIRFFADWGSLLGAVRHHGFITWDDDLDIGMLRDDYMRFLDVAPHELSSFFELKSLYNDPSHDNVKCRVITGRFMNFDKDYLLRFHECPYVIGIDIFPIDYIPRDNTRMKEQTELIELVMSIAASIPHEPPYGEEAINLIHNLEHSLGITFNWNNRIFHELKKLVDILSSSCPSKDADEVCSMIDLAGGWDYHALKEWYATSSDMPFENTTIPVPVGYDGILRIKYGDDYMTPIQRSSSHDYPFYKKQENALKDVIEQQFNIHITDDEFQELLKQKISESLNS